MLIVFVCSLMLGCGGGGSSGGNNTSGLDFDNAEEVKIGESLSLEPEDVTNIEDNGGVSTLGTVQQCTNELAGTENGCWDNELCTPAQGGGGDYWISIHVEFQGDSEGVLDIAGYFYPNDTCAGQPSMVKRFENVTFNYVKGDTTYTDSNGLTDVSPLTVTTVLTDPPVTTTTESAVLVVTSGGEKVCFSDSFKVTSTGFSVSATDSADINLDNCLNRYTPL